MCYWSMAETRGIGVEEFGEAAEDAVEAGVGGWCLWRRVDIGLWARRGLCGLEAMEAAGGAGGGPRKAEEKYAMQLVRHLVRYIAVNGLFVVLIRLRLRLQITIIRRIGLVCHPTTEYLSNFKSLLIIPRIPRCFQKSLMKSTRSAALCRVIKTCCLRKITFISVNT